MKSVCWLSVLIVLGVRFEAEACEPFRFEDPDTGRMVSFLVGSVRIPHEPEELRRRLAYYLVWRERLLSDALRPSPEKLEQRLVLHLTAAGNKKFRLCQTKSSVSDPPGTAGKIDVKVTADEKGEKLSVEKLPRGTSGVGLRGAMPSRPVLGRCCCGVAFCDCPNADQAEYRFLKRYDLVDIKV